MAPRKTDAGGEPFSAAQETTPGASQLGRRHAVRKAMMQLQARVRGRTPPFSCYLDEQPLPLAPVGALQRLRSASQDSPLFVSGSFHLQLADNDPPEDIARRALPLGGLLDNYPIAWISDPGPELWMPYWVRGDWIGILRALQPGKPAPTTLPPAMRSALALAGILVPRDYERLRAVQWKDIFARAASEFRARGYAIVRDVLHALQLGALRRYYRDLIAGGGLTLGDFQVAERYQLGDEILARFFHRQLTRFVTRVAAEPVKPSYVYLAAYRPGADLKRHTDREQCEFSISLLLDYVPEPAGASGWPLFLEDRAAAGAAHAADLGIGDALIYRGRELVHYRNPLPQGHQSTSYFLHYVDADFNGRLW